MLWPPLDISLIILVATFIVAGIVRGFSGFGSGMIAVPVVAAMTDPVTALVTIVIADSLPQLPAAIPALKKARWKEVAPLAACLVLTVPLGIAILQYSNPELLRWVICLVIMAAVLLLASGWRYRGSRTPILSGAIGAASGFLGGITGIPGPPAILYWMASPEPPAMIRANLLSLFLAFELVALANTLVNGMMTPERLGIGIVAAPAHLVGILFGWALFPMASAATYRRVAFTVILVVIMAALPVWNS